MRSRLADVAAGLTALVATVALVVGLPAALVHFVGWPLPTQLPTLQQIATFLSRRTVSDATATTIVVKSLAVVLWVAWAQLTLGLIVEAAAASSGHSARRPVLLKPFQPAAGKLVAAMALLVSTLPGSRTEPSWVLATTPHLAAVAVLEPQPTLPPSQPEPPAQQPLDGGEVVYTVALRDTWWHIAEMTLGDGTRWREIRDLNLGRTMPDGTTITSATETLHAGWQLLLPADATLPDGLPAPPSDPTTASPAPIPSPASQQTTRTVTVKEGDHFWGTAEQALKQAWGRPPTDEEITPYWRIVVQANLERLLPPHDPDLIYPGQQFVLPTPPPDPLASRQPAGTQPTAPASPTAEIAPQQQPPQPDHSQPSEVPPAAGHHEPRSRQPPAVTSPPTAPATSGQAAPRPSGTTTTPTTPSPLQTTPGTEPGAVRAQPGAPPVGAARPTLSPAPTTRVEADNGEGADDVLTAAWAIRGGALAVAAAGVVAVLERLRRAHLRRRQPGERPSTPPAPQMRTEQQLRDLADHDTTEFIDQALRALAGWRWQVGRPPPPIELVSVTDRELALHLHAADQYAPQEWQLFEEGRTWVLPRDVDRAELAERAYGVPAPAPALVTIGSTAGGRRRVLANLSRAQVLGVSGEAEQVRLTMLTQALELATSRFADYVRVVLVGRTPELAELERLEIASPDGLLKQLEVLADEVERLHAEDVEADWTPTVVFCLGVDHNVSQRLQQLARRTQGRAAVIVEGPPIEPGSSLIVEDDRCHLSPPGETLERCSFEDRELADIKLLVENAHTPPTAPTDEDVEPFTAAVPVVDLETLSPPRDEPATVEVRILGPVEIFGQWTLASAEKGRRTDRVPGHEPQRR